MARRTLRLLLWAALMLVWTVLLAGAGLAGAGSGVPRALTAIVLTGIALVYVPLAALGVPALAPQPPDPGAHPRLLGCALTVGFLACLATAAFGGVVVALGLPWWYLSHHGAETDAVVSAQRCTEGRPPDCPQHLRLTSMATERDLGWAGYTGGRRRKVGEQVRICADPDGRIPPHITACPRDSSLDVLLPVVLLAGGLAFVPAAATALPPTAAPALPSD